MSKPEITQRKKRLEKINDEAKTLEEERKKLITALVSECTHPLSAIRERPYKSYGHLPASPPWLICTECGLTVQGWGTGYGELNFAAYKDVPEISDDEWFKKRTLSKFRDGHTVL